MLSRGFASRQLAWAPAATGSKAQSTTTCQSPGWLLGDPRPPGRLGRDEGGLPRRPPDQFLDSHVLLGLPLCCHRSTRRTHGICPAGFPLPCCLSSPQFMHLQELAGRSSHLQGSLPRRCDQDHLPRSVRFGYDAERLCDPRRPRLRQPVEALTSAPRPKTQHFLFSMSRSGPTVFASLVFFFPPARPHRCSLPTARIHVQRQWGNGKWEVERQTWNVEDARRRLCPVYAAQGWLGCWSESTV